MEYELFDPTNDTHLEAIVAIWNAACGPDLAITRRGARFNTRPVTGGVLAGRLALVAGRPAAFVVAKAMPGAPLAAPADVGWVDALAALPEYQGQGIGSGLLDWAQDWLSAAGHTRIRLGGSLRPFCPGLPLALNGRPDERAERSERFFRARGYDNHGKLDYDLSSDLAAYQTPGVRMGSDCSVRPAAPEEADALQAFLDREYSGRWAFEFAEARRSGSRMSDYVILITARGIDGFLHTTYEDSYWPLDRVFPQRLPRPLAQVGPLGVSGDLRGKGYGGSLMDGALRHLAGQGIRGCVVDWTGLVDFYGKFGFRPYTQYLMLNKALNAG